MHSPNVYLFLWLCSTLLHNGTALEFSPTFGDAYAPIGQSFWWTCSVVNADQSGPLTFVWRFRDGDLTSDQSRVNYQNGTLYFPQVNPNVLGPYTCVVQAPNNIIEKSVSLNEAFISGNPSITPMNQNVFTGGEAELECIVNAQPPATFQWLMNGAVLSEGPNVIVTTMSSERSMLRITNVGYRNAGNYSCSASHLTLSQPLLTVTSTVRVYGRPQITLPPTSQAVPIGYNTKFVCGVASDPQASVDWSFASSSSSTTSPSSVSSSIFIDRDDGSLYITNASTSDIGSYTCTWTNSYGSDSASATLMVEGTPRAPIFFNTPSDTTVREGVSISLLCRGTGNPKPSVSWTLPNGEELVKYGVSSGVMVSASDGQSNFEIDSLGVLNIQNISRQFSGLYVCNLTNPEGQVSANARVTILYPPRLVNVPSNLTVNSGSGFSLPCFADGNPLPIISWTLPQGQVLTLASPGLGKNEIVSMDGTLRVFTSSSMNHNGMYTCVAKNDLNSTSVSVYVTVPGVPGFSVIPVSLGVIEGDSVTLRCEASSFPTAQIRWFFKYILDPSTNATDVRRIKDALLSGITSLPTSELLPVTPDPLQRYEFVNGSSLYFRSVQESLAGMYICQAANVYGANYAAAVLRVITFPRFQVAPLDQKVELGQTTRLDCFAVGIPVPTQRWLFNNRMLALNNAIQTYSNGSLRITNIVQDNLGAYTCLATNQAGQRSATAVLSVSDRPFLLTSPSNTSAARGDSAVLNCRGGSNMAFQLSWYQSSPSGDKGSLIGSLEVQPGASATERILTSDRVVVEVNGDLLFYCIEEADEAWYMCAVSNSDGESVSEPVFLEVTDLPVVTGMGFPDTVSAGDIMTLTCSASGAPLPTITWVTPLRLTLTNTSSQEPNLVVTETTVTPTLVQSTVTGAGDPSRHAGTWTCVPCNSLGCSSMEHMLTFSGPPMITAVASETHMNEVSLFCKPSSVADSLYYIDDQVISDAMAGHRVASNMLYIGTSQIQQNYSCRVSNMFGLSDLLSLDTPPGVSITGITASDTSLQLTLTSEVDTPGVLPNSLVIEYKNITAPVWEAESLTLNDTIDEYLPIFENIGNRSSSTVPECPAEKDSFSNGLQSFALTMTQAHDSDSVTVESNGDTFAYTIKKTVHNLQPHTNYKVRAKFGNILGFGPNSTEMEIQTLVGLPPVVTDLEVTVTVRTAQVSWTIPSPLNGPVQDIVFIIELYLLDQASTETLVRVASVSASSDPTVSFTNLVNGDYLVTVVTRNTGMNLDSAPARSVFSVRDFPPTYTPRLILVSPLDAYSLNVTWSVPSNPSGLVPPVSGYMIQVKRTPEFEDELLQENIIEISNPFTSTWIVKNLQENREYTVRVASTNMAGAGPYSNGVKALTLFALFSEEAMESPKLGSLSWPMLTVILVVVCATLIVLVAAVVLSYQVRLARSESVDLQPEPEMRGFDDDEDDEYHETNLRNGRPSERNGNRVGRDHEMEAYPNDSFTMY